MNNILTILIFIPSLVFTQSHLNKWHTINNQSLPSIYGQSIAIHNNKLYIVGGNTNLNTESFSTSLYTKELYPYNITNFTNIQWNNNPFSFTPNRIDIRSQYQLGFKCKGQCYTSHNEYLYIINPESPIYDETGYLLTFNLQISFFIDSTVFNNTLIHREGGICATNNESHIFAIGSKCHGCSTAHSVIQAFEIDSNGPWKILGNMNTGRYFSGCSIDNNKEFLYIFGGYLNHNVSSDDGDVSDSIERCSLFEDQITCSSITSTNLAIPRAEHQIISSKNDLMFIIGGINDLGEPVQIVEIFDLHTQTMMPRSFWSYITNGITSFSAFYDSSWDVLYVLGGMDTTGNILNSIQYLPICELYNNCYERKITIQCGDVINQYISNPRQVYPYYFEITDAENILSIEYDNCGSSIDTYVGLFFYNETSRKWNDGDHWDDGGENCDGLKQEAFILDNPEPGYYQLAVSAHEIGTHSGYLYCEYPTKDPTLEPTLLPTVEPTIDPTTNPTIDTTTEEPSLSPTANLMTPLTTNLEVASTANLDIATSENDEEVLIEFSLSFICESKRDLRMMDWQSLIINGLLNALKPDLEQHDVFIADTLVQGRLTYLEDEEQAIEIKERFRRHLLERDIDEVFYYNIEVNVTMQRLHLSERDVSYFCGTKFVNAFIEGLGEDINRVQIYDIGTCDEALLVDTWTANGDVKDVGHLHKGILSMLPIIILVGVCILLILSGIFVQCLRKIDSLKIGNLLVFCANFWNFYADIFWAVDIWFLLVQNNQFHDILFIFMAVISMIIVLFPFFKNLYDVTMDAEYWESDIANGERIADWIANYGKFTYFLIFISGTTYGAVELINSNLFGLRMFGLGLTPALHRSFRQQKIWMILTANIPQIAIQCIIFVMYGYADIYGIFALFASMTSVLLYFNSLCCQYDYNGPNAKPLIFSWRMSSVSISAKANYYRNKSQILRKYLMKELKINPKEERLDMLPAEQYFDTDIGGLTISILITTNLDKYQDEYMDRIQNLIENNILSDKIKQLWDLPATENVNCYGVKYVGGMKNTHSVSMISMRKHSSLPTINRHLKMNSNTMPTSGYITKNALLVEEAEEGESSSCIDDGETDGIGPCITKTKKDFVSVTTYDDDDDIISTPQRVWVNGSRLPVANYSYEHGFSGFSLNSNTTPDLLKS